MKCSKCNTEMIKGTIGKGIPLNIRFVPEQSKMMVTDYARLQAYACPECGYLELTVDTETLLKTVKDTT